MTRKNESILDLLVSCPWWVSVLASGIAFVFLKFILPSQTSMKPVNVKRAISRSGSLDPRDPERLDRDVRCKVRFHWRE
jgi:hypothetical protein